MMIRRVEELPVYQLAMDLAMGVFAVSRAFPYEERFNQVRRSSRSVAANISEAWRKRRYPAAFASKMNDAEAEAGETQTWLEFAIRCGYAPEESVAPLIARYNEVLGQLVTMINATDRWCSPLARDR